MFPLQTVWTFVPQLNDMEHVFAPAPDVTAQAVPLHARCVFGGSDDALDDGIQEENADDNLEDPPELPPDDVEPLEPESLQQHVFAPQSAIGNSQSPFFPRQTEASEQISPVGHVPPEDFDPPEREAFDPVDDPLHAEVPSGFLQLNCAFPGQHSCPPGQYALRTMVQVLLVDPPVDDVPPPVAPPLLPPVDPPVATPVVPPVVPPPPEQFAFVVQVFAPAKGRRMQAGPAQPWCVYVPPKGHCCAAAPRHACSVEYGPPLPSTHICGPMHPQDSPPPPPPAPPGLHVALQMGAVI